VTSSSSPFALLWSRAGDGGLDERAGAPDDNLTAADRTHLARAVDEAWRGFGRTAPNPPVGAVVVKDGEVLATGFHAKAGERHAEVVALDELKRLGEGRARGATLYVTLEPCVHHGRTPPCADRVLAEGVARVVVGAVDPNPRVHEMGIAKLRAAGVTVDVAAGVVGDRCRALIAPFTSTMLGKRPWVVLKTATSLDARVATSSGASRWITGEAARARVHALRDRVDAVLVGAGTVLKDDPALTTRLPGGRDARRVVIDGALRTSPSARVYAPAVDRPLVVHARAPVDRAAAFDAAGVDRLERPGPEGRVDLAAALAALAPRALSVLVEAGPGLAGALLAAGLVDEIWWMTAPVVLGADAVPAVGPLAIPTPADAPRWRVVHREALGDDALVVLRRPLPA
jgi:diaminohydroxyphosphoribosylaminopyrimidine deaminase/5-amino-6-(5-phosphoribosylamino)uracil reductase